MIKEYKDQLLYFIKRKKYIISVIITMILSFGYVVTHEAIGVDDLCFDRYVNGTYWLSANRWGMWLIYNLLNLKEYTPFWIDALSAILIGAISIILCAFVRKNFGKIIKSTWAYVVFSCILISSPLMNNFYIYQISNLSIIFSNLIIIILGIWVFENYFNKTKRNNTKIILLAGLASSVIFSMYESCAQTYLVFIFASIFFKSITANNKKENKDLIKFFFLNIVILTVGVIIFNLTNKLVNLILKLNGTLVLNYASNRTTLFNETFINYPFSYKLIAIRTLLDDIIYDIKSYFPITIFAACCIITIVIELIHLIKTSKTIRAVSFLGIIFSNFIITILMLVFLHRIQFSIIITTAFLCGYIYNVFCSKKILKYIINICALLLILNQSKTLNQYFYNDYKRYDREKFIVNSIAVEVVNNFDYENKPLIFYVKEKTGNIQQKYGRINRENSVSIIFWGLNGFDEPQVELIKFVNYYGFSFKYPTSKQVENAKNEYNNLEEEERKNIVEFEDYIVVNLDKYDMFKEFKR